MISQETYKREKRRLAIARGRFDRARCAVPPNPYSNELNGSGREALERALTSAARLFDVARDGLDLFIEEGYPDTWARWDSAERDAAAFIARHRSDAVTLGLTV